MLRNLVWNIRIVTGPKKSMLRYSAPPNRAGFCRQYVRLLWRETSLRFRISKVSASYGVKSRWPYIQALQVHLRLSLNYFISTMLAHRVARYIGLGRLPMLRCTRARVAMDRKLASHSFHIRSLATASYATVVVQEQRLPTFRDEPIYAPSTPSTGLQDTNERCSYWQTIPLWKETTEEQFLDYAWQVSNTVQGKDKLAKFLYSVLPEHLPHDELAPRELQHIRDRDTFVQDVLAGMLAAPMSIRITPHILSIIDWTKPLSDPIRRQFIPLKSSLLPDHPKLQLDSLNETGDSPTPGLVHRYHDKALFLAVSVCPVYCRFCTRSYSVGAPTDEVSSKKSFTPTRRRWENMFGYIENTPRLTDIVVSGGDSYYLPAEHLISIGERLLSVPHIRRIRIASKGLAVCPSRILSPGDPWTAGLIGLSKTARELGKSVALHTHFNHPREMTWVSRLAAQKLYGEGVTVRNQTVLLRGVNDDIETMKELVRTLADNNITPYYIYQGDMVSGVEDLRTPLSTILEIERHIRGSIAGFVTPNFVVDLPGGGGKRLANSYDSYDPVSGLSRFVLPSKNGGQDRVYEYWDPVRPTTRPSFLDEPNAKN